MANFVGSELPLIVGLIIVTSLAVPFVLPPIVHILFGSHFSIPVIHMIVLLAVALFIPLLAGWFTKKFAPKIAEIVSEKSLYLSIILIVLINMALFSKFSTFFFESPVFVVEMVLIAFLLFGIYGTVGYALTSFTTGVTSRTTSEGTTTSSKSNTKMEWNRYCSNRRSYCDGVREQYPSGSFRRTIFWYSNRGPPSIIQYSLLYWDHSYKKVIFSTCKASYGLSETIGDEVELQRRNLH